MYQVGDAVLYGSNGICRIREVTRMESCGMVDDFYVLKPVSSEATTVFVPLGSEILLSRMHPLLSPTEMRELLDGLSDAAPIWVENENQRKTLYREIMNSGDRSAIFRVYLTDFLAGRYDLNVRYLDLIPDPNRKSPPDPQEGRKRIRNKLSQ